MKIIQTEFYVFYIHFVSIFAEEEEKFDWGAYLLDGIDRYVPSDDDSSVSLYVMRKPVYVICEQQRRRSACASTQSDQHLCCSLPG